MTLTTTEAPIVTRKLIKWATNYNNKMDCDGILHIDIAPKIYPRRSDLEKTIIDIKTLDGSHPGVSVMIYDLLPFVLKHTIDFWALASHGMLATEYVEWLFDKYQGEGISFDTDMVVYFYRKVKTA